MANEGRKSELRDALQASREKTLWLLDYVPQDFLKVRVHDFYSPIGWHFGHIGRTEEYWISHKAMRLPVSNDKLSFLFADLPENPKDNRVNLPSRQEIVDYLSSTRATALMMLDKAEFEPDNPFLAEGYAWDFALQHECQHQETICEMLQLIQKQMRGQNGVGAPLTARLGAGAGTPLSLATEDEYVEIPAGRFTMGTNETCVYDNERRAHEVTLNAFKLAKHPVTTAEWFDFMSDGGYLREGLWSEEGWIWRCAQEAERPEYWSETNGQIGYCGPYGVREIHPQEPVTSICWYEADAYARWAGKRLPTEEEWEYAASMEPESNQKRRYPWGEEPPNSQTAVSAITSWGPRPVGERSCGASAFGLLDMAGNVWEWTSSKFLPYPGFSAFPYDGYSKDHMRGGHYVCRGGSWATAAPILRCTFRNWYVPTYRQGFLGLRCADD